jgi:3-deoxy-D-manno-octulosonate 8-phosphate phosphatase (KDO 8-P phosphatase)
MTIKVLLTDVDGVLTDGSLFYSSNGIEMKKFNVKDGLICKSLIQKGIILGIITGRKSEIVEIRGKELGFKYIMQAVDNKLETALNIASFEKIALENIAYIGDDLNDLDLLAKVGFSGAPADALDQILKGVDHKCDIREAKVLLENL